MRYWGGFSQRVGKRWWLNWSRSGLSLTRSLGGGARVNWSPRNGVQFRFSKRLKWW
jgi:hypothetical protein